MENKLTPEKKLEKFCGTLVQVIDKIIKTEYTNQQRIEFIELLLRSNSMNRDVLLQDIVKQHYLGRGGNR